MPYGKGTYGSKVGRPPKKRKKKTKGKKRKTYASARGPRKTRERARR
jgi:hypothetical protein